MLIKEIVIHETLSLYCIYSFRDSTRTYKPCFYLSNNDFVILQMIILYFLYLIYQVFY